MRGDPRHWYCFVCGQGVKGEYWLVSELELTTEVKIAHSRCTRYLQQGYLVHVIETPDEKVCAELKKKKCPGCGAEGFLFEMPMESYPEFERVFLCRMCWAAHPERLLIPGNK